jgi:hypothetical protein
VGAGGGAVGFARLSGMGSQPTGRGYASSLTDMLGKGPFWGAYKTMTGHAPEGRQAEADHDGDRLRRNVFPAAYNYNFGFPVDDPVRCSRAIPARSRGNPHITTLTAKGGDTVTAMGKRNISLVTGGLARAVIGPIISNTSEVGQMYLPEPSRATQLVAGAFALLGVAAWRARRR